MKTSGKLIIITVAVLAILLILATPAMADQKSLVCDGADECKIHLAFGPTTYQAGEPFYIVHVLGITVGDPYPIMAGHIGFALEVDGEYIEPSWNCRGLKCPGVDIPPPPLAVWSGSAFNFPQGLPAGEHVFTGHWFMPPCLPQEDGCEEPVEPVDIGILDLTVTFVP